MMQMFQDFATPEQKRLALLVEQKGGDAVIDNEQVMRELLDAETQIPASTGMGRHKPSKKFDLTEIQREIRDDPIEAIEKNAEFFNRKFDIQRRQIQEDTEHAVSRERDRIISAATGGPPPSELMDNNRRHLGPPSHEFHTRESRGNETGSGVVIGHVDGGYDPYPVSISPIIKIICLLKSLTCDPPLRLPAEI